MIYDNANQYRKMADGVRNRYIDWINKKQDTIYIAKSLLPNAGYGVFAKKDIEEGEIITACPLIELKTYRLQSVGSGIGYFMNDKIACLILRSVKKLGESVNFVKSVNEFRNIYESLMERYMMVDFIPIARDDKTVLLIANRDILKDEEIYRAYGS